MPVCGSVFCYLIARPATAAKYGFTQVTAAYSLLFAAIADTLEVGVVAWITVRKLQYQQAVKFLPDEVVSPLLDPAAQAAAALALAVSQVGGENRALGSTVAAAQPLWLFLVRRISERRPSAKPLAGQVDQSHGVSRFSAALRGYVRI